MKGKSITLFAYGTNISKSEMTKHSPNCVFIGYGELQNFALRFQGFDNHAIATLEKLKGAVLPVAIYDLTPIDRFTIDNLETFPYSYKKIKAKATLNGKTIKGFVYVLKANLPTGKPSKEYVKALRMAYFQSDFDDKYIEDALQNSGLDPKMSRFLEDIEE